MPQIHIGTNIILPPPPKLRMVPRLVRHPRSSAVSSTPPHSVANPLPVLPTRRDIPRAAPNATMNITRPIRLNQIRTRRTYAAARRAARSRAGSKWQTGRHQDHLDDHAADLDVARGRARQAIAAVSARIDVVSGSP